MEEGGGSGGCDWMREEVVGVVRKMDGWMNGWMSEWMDG